MSLDRVASALVDRYTVIRELGRGGLATVYLAEDLRHHRKVAIKVLKDDVSASVGATRFLREIEIAAQLQHPHILYALGVVAYELIAGRTPFTSASPQQMLAAHVTEKPDPPSRHRPGIAPPLEIQPDISPDGRLVAYDVYTVDVTRK